MLFFPNGVMPGEVIDPDKLAKEFLEAAALSGQTDQWNWKQDILTRAMLNAPERCQVEQVSAVCTLQSTNVGIFPTDGPPVLPNDPAADPDLWKVPFKRGMFPIGEGTTAGTLELRWTSPYPELLMIVLSFQYVRDYMGGLTYIFGADTGIENRAVVRMQSRIMLDGALLPGTGPFSVPIYTMRGTGYGANAAAISVVWVGVVPAGAHVVQGVAGQADTAAVSEETVYDSESPDDGVCIGTRNLFAVRFARGDILQGG